MHRVQLVLAAHRARHMLPQMARGKAGLLSLTLVPLSLVAGGGGLVVCTIAPLCLCLVQTPSSAARRTAPAGRSEVLPFSAGWPIMSWLADIQLGLVF